MAALGLRLCKSCGSVCIAIGRVLLTCLCKASSGRHAAAWKECECLLRVRYQFMCNVCVRAAAAGVLMYPLALPHVAWQWTLALRAGVCVAGGLSIDRLLIKFGVLIDVGLHRACPTDLPMGSTD